MSSRTFLMVLAAAGLAGCGRSPAGRLYRSEDGNFGVAMPGTPKETQQVAGTIPIHVLTAEDGAGVAFNVTYNDVPADLATPEKANGVLDRTTSGLAAGGRNRIIEAQPLRLVGHPGREVEFAAGTRRGTSRIYLIGPRLYQVMVVAPGATLPPAAESFLDSFRLLHDVPPIAVASSPTPTGPATPPTSPTPTGPTTPPTPAAPTPTPATPAPVAGASAGFGKPDDPDGDCQVRVEGGVATITVPGTLHDLSGRAGRFNAPRLLRPVEGAFLAEVKVVGEVRPAGGPTRPGSIPFHGAGLLLWGDAGNFIRLERAAVLRDGVVRPYILLEHHLSGGPPIEQAGQYAGGPVSLRLQRLGSRVVGSFSTDGVRWEELPALEFDFPPQAAVGVAAVNTASEPLKARFEGFKVDKQ